MAGLVAEELLSENGEAGYGAVADMENVKNYVVDLVNNGLTDQGPIRWEILSVEQQKYIKT